jgi:hypothetical protein
MKAWLRMALVTTTVGGGFTGVLLNSAAIRSSFHAQTYIESTAMVLFLILSIFVTVAGLMFVQHPHQTWPLLIALGIQIPRISSPFLVYAFSTGFQFALAVIATATENGGPAVTLRYTDYFGTTGTFDMFHQHPLGLGINFWALAMFVLLWRSVQMTVPQTRHEDSSHMGPKPAESAQLAKTGDYTSEREKTIFPQN